VAHRFSVRVIDQRGNPYVDVRVYAHQAGLLGEAGSEYTNSDGWVTFENPYWSDEKTAYGVTIYVLGEEFGPFDITGDDSFSVTV